jgi:hypothetical protein
MKNDRSLPGNDAFPRRERRKSEVRPTNSFIWPPMVTLNAIIVGLMLCFGLAFECKKRVLAHKTHFPGFRSAIYPPLMLNFGSFIDNRIDFLDKTL